MTSISIIGSGIMAAAIGSRAVKHGHTVELISRTPAKARALADQIGDGAGVATFGATPQGEIVIVAVPYQAAVDVVAAYGTALTGKILLDITNPFNADGTGLVTTPGNSMTHRIAAAAPAGAHVVKAFNTIFGHVLAKDEPLDGFLAGDDANAKARVSALLTSLGMRPLDTGGLDMAHALEWAGIFLVGVARSGTGFDLALAAEAR